MQGVPLAMAEDNYIDADFALALQMHILGMYVPSLFSGDVIRRVGPRVGALAGFTVEVAGAALFLLGRSVAHYTGGIALVGIGWIFAFVSSSVACAAAAPPEHRTALLSLNVSSCWARPPSPSP